MFFTYPMESFVARHVIVILLHDGDIDGTDDPNYNGHNEAGGYLFLNRRQTLTFSIFILTLIPALVSVTLYHKVLINMLIYNVKPFVCISFSLSMT